MSLTRSCTAVTSSCAIIRYEPSPTRTKTSRSGAASLTPRPPAISYPMQEYPYSTWYPFGSRVRHNLCRSPGIEPAAHTTTSRASETSLTAPSTSDCAGSGVCPRWYADSTAASHSCASAVARSR